MELPQHVFETPLKQSFELLLDTIEATLNHHWNTWDSLRLEAKCLCKRSEFLTPWIDFQVCEIKSLVPAHMKNWVMHMLELFYRALYVAIRRLELNTILNSNSNEVPFKYYTSISGGRGIGGHAYFAYSWGPEFGKKYSYIIQDSCLRWYKMIVLYSVRLLS